MKQRYLYPQNMKASANMWLWSLRDFAILAMAALLSVVFAALTKIILPLALVLCFGVLTIRADDMYGILYDTVAGLVLHRNARHFNDNRR